MKSPLLLLPAALLLGALAGLLTVALGAFGAHALEGRLTEQALQWWAKAVHYQGLHALALVLFMLGKTGYIPNAAQQPASQEQSMQDIIRERYPLTEWNIYAAQASDGDNWDDDSTTCRDLLMSKIMPGLQYFAYVEITPDAHQTLWQEYQRVADA